jgi:hypothetical protein
LSLDRGLFGFLGYHSHQLMVPTLIDAAVLSERERCATCVEVHIDSTGMSPRLRTILRQISQDIRLGETKPQRLGAHREGATAGDQRDTTPWEELPK